VTAMPQINHIPPRPYIPAELGNASARSQAQSAGPVSFQDILLDRIGKEQSVTFSKHAVERMQSRNISFSPDEIARIGRTIDAAAAKGARESLIVTDNTAMVVNVGSRTVITCMDRAGMNDHVFTNIDSAAIVT
jgi:flagellar operon protein